MTSIIGYADMIYQKKRPENEVGHAAEYIMNEGMRLEALSVKLMKLSAMQQQDYLFEETDIELVFADVSQTVEPDATRRGIDYSFQCDPGWIKIDIDLFKTLLVNLLDNAFKSGCSAVSLEGCNKEDYYLIFVRDNGRGIPSVELSRITEAFYMIDKSRSRKDHGAGLGLALAAKIAELHGTQLEYTSTEGVGTTVSIRMRRIGENEETK